MTMRQSAVVTADDLVDLSNASLTSLPADISVPSYDRAALTPGIVHIGLGNFHRAHQAWYLHRLMQQGDCHDWAILGAGVRAFDKQQRMRLIEQNCLTSLIELSPTSTSVEVVGSMIDYLSIDEDNAALIAAMADPSIRIVSLTVTESGYFLDPATKDFDAKHPDIQHDVASFEKPKTAFGAIIEALRQRRENGDGPFTIQSCDNLQGNGDKCKQTVLGLAQLSNTGLANWIETHCSFPNSMVDCIVPATGDAELALIKELGIDDAVPVTHENFRQWVIEDAFCAGRPNWEDAGATFTDRVHDYESMKIQILNAGHQIVANAGELLSIETISGCMDEPLIKDLFDKVELNEIVPQIRPVPDIAPEAYSELISERFSNPAIVDTTRRVSFDGSSRHPGFLHPIIRQRIAQARSTDGLALVEALWARMCAGTREDGSAIENNDPNWDALFKVANLAKQDPAVWLAQSQYYGDLKDDPQFRQTFAKWLSMLWSDGVKETLRTFTQT